MTFVGDVAVDEIRDVIVDDFTNRLFVPLTEIENAMYL